MFLQNMLGGVRVKNPIAPCDEWPPLAWVGYYQILGSNMGKVINLTLHKNTLRKRQRKLARKTLTRVANHVSRNTKVDGFALVTFTISDQGTVSHSVHYDVPSPSFAFILPQMAQQALFAAIIEKEPDNED